MGGEMTGLGKTLIAPILITDKRPVPCVDAFVSGEIAGLVETTCCIHPKSQTKGLPPVWVRLCLVR